MLICLTEPTFPGCLIPVNPVGMFVMADDKGPDDKVICVPLHGSYWNGNVELEDLPALLRDEIEQAEQRWRKAHGRGEGPEA